MHTSTPQAVSLLFVRTDRLGEALLTLPAIQALREAWPAAHLIMMTHPSLRELLSDHPDLDEVIAEPTLVGPWWWQRAWTLSRLWRAWNVGTIVISNPKREYHVAAWLARIPTRVGYDRKWGWCLTHRLLDEKARGRRHEIEQNLDVLRPLGIPASSTPIFHLPVQAEEQQRVSELLSRLGLRQTDRLIAVHPWTSNARKQWPPERFRDLMGQLSIVPGARVVLVGSADHQAEAAARFDTGHPGALDLVGRLSLRELAALFVRIRVLVSSDSGPVHLASAVGTPTVALFANSNPATGPTRWGPWGRGHTVLAAPSLEAIGVTEVVEAVRGYL